MGKHVSRRVAFKSFQQTPGVIYSIVHYLNICLLCFQDFFNKHRYLSQLLNSIKLILLVSVAVCVHIHTCKYSYYITLKGATDNPNLLLSFVFIIYSDLI